MMREWATMPGERDRLDSVIATFTLLQEQGCLPYLEARLMGYVTSCPGMGGGHAAGRRCSNYMVGEIQTPRDDAWCEGCGRDRYPVFLMPMPVPVQYTAGRLPDWRAGGISHPLL